MEIARRLDVDKMSRFPEKIFSAVLLLAVGLSVSFVLTLIAVQAEYSGGVSVWKAISDRGILHSLALSVCTTTASSVLALILAVPTGYALARWNVKGLWLIDALLVVPVVMSPMSLGVALLLFFKTELGRWIDQEIIRFVFDVPGIMLAQFIMAFAFSLIIVRNTFSGIDVKLEHVARFLGSSRWQAFRYVALPLARNGILAAFILAWARVIGEFGSTSTIGGAIPGKTETIPITIYLNLATVSIEKSVALSLILTLVTVAAVMGIYIILRKK